MSKAILTPEEGAELTRLWSEYLAATEFAKEVCRAKGMDCDEFKSADAKAGAARRKVRELLGTTGQHWVE